MDPDDFDTPPALPPAVEAYLVPGSGARVVGDAARDRGDDRGAAVGGVGAMAGVTAAVAAGAEISRASQLRL